MDSDLPTKPSLDGYDCDHIDMCGDTLVEVKGDRRVCASCAAWWPVIHVVIVGDEHVV
jgi:hypothetical protein